MTLPYNGGNRRLRGGLYITAENVGPKDVAETREG